MTDYLQHFDTLAYACGLQGCKNRSIPFPGQMSKKVTKPGSVCHILACFYCVVSRVVFVGKVNEGDEMDWP